MIINDDQNNWADKCPMVEFALNSSVSATTGFAPFKLNEGYMPQLRMPTSFDTTFKGVKQFMLQVKWDLMAAHDTIIVNRVQQMFHANKKCRASDLYHVGDHVYLSTQNLTLPKGRVRKLVPKYVGSYKVVKAHNEASTVTLELPPVLIAQRSSPTFHMGLVWKFIANNDKLFPKRDVKSFYDFGQDNEQEWLVKEITCHRWWAWMPISTCIQF